MVDSYNMAKYVKSLSTSLFPIKSQNIISTNNSIDLL